MLSRVRPQPSFVMENQGMYSRGDFFHPSSQRASGWLVCFFFNLNKGGPVKKIPLISYAHVYDDDDDDDNSYMSTRSEVRPQATLFTAAS